MFLRLGALLVGLIVLVVVVNVIVGRVVMPALRRRNLAKLEAENKRLDDLLDQGSRRRTR